MYWLPALVLVVTITGAQSQATAQSSVAPELRECYINTNLLDNNNLPPTTIQVLIDIIQKIEDNPDVNVDLRMMATLLLHTYRQDGIEYHQREAAATTSNIVLPYAPTFHSFHRHRLLLKMIPNNLQTLANGTLPATLKCAIHRMMSMSVDSRVRGDESNCNQLSQYRALRTARSVDINKINKDVEILDLKKLGADQNGRMRQYDPNNDVEFSTVGGSKSARQLAGESICPIHTGVINTRWGAVAAGNLIASIAAGAETQRVPINDLTRGTELNYQNIQSYVTTIYPASLSGDLAEAVLIQGTRGSSSISVGSTGNWNSTQATRFYMLSSRTNLEMTDPEIRGGIDGFVLGSNLGSTLGSFSSLKLSQLLDMYYTPRNGVFNSALRACNRRELSEQNIVTANLAAETKAFTAALDTVIPLQGTLVGGIDGLIDSAITQFRTHTTSNLNDLNCDNSETLGMNYRSKTNLYLVLDTTWPYETIYPVISYIVDNIEIGKFGSSITLLSAFDGRVLINKTFSMADFHTQYTRSSHQSYMSGVNLESVYLNVRDMMQNELRNESSINYVGGNSTVLLFLLNSGNIQNDQNIFEHARVLNETVPDLTVLYATSTNQFDSLWSLVRDMYNDIFTIQPSSSGTNIQVINPLLNRIQEIPRRVINPTCGADFIGGSSGTRQFDDFVEPGYINYYKISPNYFYTNDNNRKLRISRSAVGMGSFEICYSRTIALPRKSDNADANIVCQTLATTGNVEISLQNLCEGYNTIGSCPPMYFSVESTGTTTTSSAICTDLRVCRFPYNIRYQIQVEELGCYSKSTSLGVSALFVMFGLIINMIRMI